mmetsp:Transcript_12926/g.17008  ORF Transcript_12926/g.17008 Transcript_12926/m.17008 type:complete len:298 (-) Transcript_12926:92-985(-)|eukprot:CAMPEP_0117757088 /NCGR_PEP_ID=MMETSP0947-20121206/14501_1 /TAXON_ID=44440 /ORGANISM="Chattonella subsalsa, Strain CCMP2191" /LENGTH=297 /DNA_ID=CAMNT_0005576871 /DNA_START=15 /DNA_END=908 /DNA_ORIENTATION=+
MFGFGPSAQITLNFDGVENRPRKNPVPSDKTQQPQFIFLGDEPVSGQVEVIVSPGKRLEHQGVKIELIGQIEMFYDRGNSYEFTSLVRELEAPGILVGRQQYSFDFTSVEKPHESYNGINVRLRYFVKVTITKNYGSNVVQEVDFIVQNPISSEPDINNQLKMEVGIEECLHIEFEYDKSKYHLQDVIIGKIFFLLVKIKMKHMEVAIIRREAAGTNANQYNETETLTKFEVMDGAPVKGECLPLRLFLKTYDLTPTYRNINNRFSVRYYLNLVLVDVEDRRYFKQQEITLWRKVAG